MEIQRKCCLISMRQALTGVAESPSVSYDGCMFLNREQLLKFAQQYKLTSIQLEALAQQVGFALDEHADLDATVVLNQEQEHDTEELADFQSSNRYALHERIGVGGMGEVYRAWDNSLRRFVALKVLHSKKNTDSNAQRRFLQEARLSGRIQHGNIAPIYEIGRLQDDRLFYAMPEIAGRSFADILKENKWPLRRLIHITLQVVEATCVSHEQSIAHLDLKPSNIMISENGSVYLVDWGLAQTLNSDGTLEDTQHTIEGTPAYMAPEQAMGRFDQVGVKSDVYAIGSILYEILSGQAPYNGKSPKAVINKVITQPPIPLRTLTQSLAHTTELPDRKSLRANKERPIELIELCEKAMIRRPEARTISMFKIRNELQAWLDGIKQKERAELAVSFARMYMQQAQSLQLQKKQLTQKVNQYQTELKPHAPLEGYTALWTQQEELDKVTQDLVIMQERVQQQLHTALHFLPNYEGANLALLEFLIAQLDASEAAHDPTQIELHQYQIRSLLKHLPEEHPDVIAIQQRLKKHTTLSIQTTPAQAEIRLFHYTEQDHRLQEGDCLHVLQSPVEKLSLPTGSYRLHITHPECAPTFFPLLLKPNQDPDRNAVHIDLLTPQSLKAQENYVPAGWFIFGSGDLKLNSLSIEEIWVDGFIAMRFPVRQDSVLQFLNHLVDHKEDSLIETIIPRHHTHLEGHTPPALYIKDAQGYFRLPDEPDAEGDLLKSDYPALATNMAFIKAYAAWKTQQDQLDPTYAWRLPTHHEWEKMARGADDRRYPWGNRYAPQWAHTNYSYPHNHIGPVDAFPIDESPYGIRSLAGCIREFTSQQRQKDRRFEVKGGSWFDPPRHADITSCNFFLPHTMYGNVGFRLVRSISPQSLAGFKA